MWCQDLYTEGPVHVGDFGPGQPLKLIYFLPIFLAVRYNMNVIFMFQDGVTALHIVVYN